MPSHQDDKSIHSKDPSPTAYRKRGRPRRQIIAIETDQPEAEPKRKLRSQIPAGPGTLTDDPWAILSKAPSITPMSPNKPRKARHQGQKKKPVNDPFCSFQLCYYSDHILTREKMKCPAKKKTYHVLTNIAKCIFLSSSSKYF
jgi:hypothetical protein